MVWIRNPERESILTDKQTDKQIDKQTDKQIDCLYFVSLCSEGSSYFLLKKRAKLVVSGCFFKDPWHKTFRLSVLSFEYFGSCGGLLVSVPTIRTACLGFESRPGAFTYSGLRGGRSLCENCTNEVLKKTRPRLAVQCTRTLYTVSVSE